MKTALSILGILLAAAVFAASVSAHGPGVGWGLGYPMNPGVMGPGYNWPYVDSNENMTEEQRERREQLDREFFGEMSVLQNKLGEKINKRDALLDSPDPDFDEVKHIHEEIRDIQAQMNELQINYEYEVRGLTPDGSNGNGQGEMRDGDPMGGGGMSGYRR